MPISDLVQHLQALLVIIFWGPEQGYENTVQGEFFEYIFGWQLFLTMFKVLSY